MIVKKRGKWLFQDKDAKIHKFKTEAEAQLAFDPPARQEEPVVSWPEIENAEEEDYEEEGF